MICARCKLPINSPVPSGVGLHPLTSDCIAALLAHVEALEARLPHVAERTQCVSCGHVWVAVGPLFNDGDGAQCPRCHRHTGAPMYPEGN